MAMGDFDRDGNADLAVANYRGDDVSVLLGNGDGTFQEEMEYQVGEGPWSVAIGDLDGDRLLDLAVASFASSAVSVLLGNGNGTFRAPGNLEMVERAKGLALGDVAGDGDLDLAVTSSSGDSVTVLINTSDSEPAWGVSSLVGPGSAGPSRRVNLLASLFVPLLAVWTWRRRKGRPAGRVPTRTTV